MRRKYMDLSNQDFCTTTALMLDEELPPSSQFCIPDNIEGASYTNAGDVITSKCSFIGHFCSPHLCWVFFLDAPLTPISPFKPHNVTFPDISTNYSVSMKNGFAVIHIPKENIDKQVHIIK